MRTIAAQESISQVAAWQSYARARRANRLSARLSIDTVSGWAKGPHDLPLRWQTVAIAATLMTSAGVRAILIFTSRAREEELNMYRFVPKFMVAVIAMTFVTGYVRADDKADIKASGKACVMR